MIGLTKNHIENFLDINGVYMNYSIQNYCYACCNATIEPKLTSDNDLSYIGVGKTESGYRLHIRSGDGKPTALIVSKWEESLGSNVDIGEYKMKFCPECGRRLIENVD